MESSVAQFAVASTFKFPPFLPPSSQPRQLSMMKMSCTKTLSENDVIADEEVVNFKKNGHRCREAKGVAELMECLECEAIMGEDHGKDPGDYSRRARIFDKSSEVFQALKHNNNVSSTVVD